jgi:uncharacterized protein YeaO (DUF488 family)
MIQIKRVYDPPSRDDGARILAERLWPRGVKKESLDFDAWPKEIAPGTELRKWFQHDPEKWPEFQRRYRMELEGHPSAWQPILELAKKGNVTLLYSSHDAQHNNVAALKSFLEERL